MKKTLCLLFAALTLAGCDNSSSRARPDTEPPVVTAPADLAVVATSDAGIDASDSAIQSFLDSVSATDNVGVVGEIGNDAPASFPVGATDVTFTATDAAGNEGSATATVTVSEPPDTEDPVVSAPSDLTLPAETDTGSLATEPAIAAFLQAATATDDRGVVGAITNDAPTEFLIGATMVTFSASDAAGNIGTASATVTITDATEPVVVAPDPISVVGSVADGAPVSDSDIAAFLQAASATDNVAVVGGVTDDAPSTFPFGLTEVTFEATDAEGNVGRASANVRVTLPGTAYLISASNGSNGYELWRTDGTADGTALVRDINPGGSANINQIVRVGDLFYFSASDGVSGQELWVSDGSAEGTRLVHDINPGIEGSFPDELTVIGSQVAFKADESVAGDELWISDGTSAGTRLVKDIRVGDSGSDLREMVEFNGELYFSADDGVTGYELWRSDGTEQGTEQVADIYPGNDQDSSFPAEFTAFGDVLMFRALSPASGTELWRTDGTAAGTRLVADIAPGTINGYPENLVTIGDEGSERLVFGARRNAAEGTEPWVSDGTVSGTQLLRDIKPQSSVPEFDNGSRPFDMTVTSDGSLYFLAEAQNFAGPLVFMTDGTPAGTELVETGPTSPPYSNAYFLSAIGSRVLFSAEEPVDGRVLWTSDGTEAGTLPILDTHPNSTSGSRPENLVEDQYAPNRSQPTPRLVPASTGGDLLLLTTPDQGRELWRTDGTASGTQIVLDIDPGTGNGIHPGAG